VSQDDVAGTAQRTGADVTSSYSYRSLGLERESVILVRVLANSPGVR